MPDQPKSDIVMQFVADDGPVLAECALDKNPNDPFMNGFDPATYTNYSNFFEVSKFEFGIEVKDEDKSKGRLQKDAKDDKKGKKEKKGNFMSWRSATDKQVSTLQYPLEFDTFSFTRLIDRASAIFFEACCGTQSFPSATLVKRVAIDEDLAATGFLQIKFKKVLIIGLDWDDGDMLNETCKFICQGFDIQYRKQSATGTLGPAVSASWDQKRDAMPGVR